MITIVTPVSLIQFYPELYNVNADQSLSYPILIRIFIMKDFIVVDWNISLPYDVVDTSVSLIISFLLGVWSFGKQSLRTTSTKNCLHCFVAYSCSLKVVHINVLNILSGISEILLTLVYAFNLIFLFFITSYLLLICYHYTVRVYFCISIITLSKQHCSLFNKAFRLFNSLLK